ncbi:uncharacterized protein ColSpa_09603 [Colletotrichum spaethianum]|uniref:Uncharacterized protein n=1 Tax=Colletotrichum spaethianum TaxID=700344 RepID=A0AA37PBZ9_9PEZI|nr:uncharacterized protein ColSpa_09603 [Colletotrichum spaethianum]GKT49422.1 hypothetical protein ColSpa_09603 [Colletotrichum spaethianum]
MLRDWCKNKHVTFESMTPDEMRLACHRAWNTKIEEWKRVKDPPLCLGWEDERDCASIVADPAALDKLDRPLLVVDLQ